jgi:hypothetical protein
MEVYQMKKAIAFLLIALLITALFAGCTKNEIPVHTTPTSQIITEVITEYIETVQEIDWLSPMLSVSVSANEASVFDGVLAVIDTNDFGRENRGMVVAEIPVEGGATVPAQLTAADLLSMGAVKMTADFAYKGDKEYNIRFRVRVDMFQGHSVTTYGLGAMTGVLVLWQDANGTWWNIRRTGWGGEFTGGTDTPGWFNAAGEPYPVFTFDINKDTAANYEIQDFYIVFLDEAPLRKNDAGIVTDETAGYVITYQVELPDDDGHFHNFLILASASNYIHIPEDKTVHAHDDDDCDDDDIHGQSH